MSTQAPPPQSAGSCASNASGATSTEIYAADAHLTPARKPGVDAVTVSVADAAHALGIGKTTLYALIASKKVVVVKIGRRTLVRVDSIRSLVNST